MARRKPSRLTTGRLKSLSVLDSTRHKLFDRFCLWARRYDPFAIRQLVYHCFPYTSMPSVALHVVELAFFKRVRAPQSGESPNNWSFECEACLPQARCPFVQSQDGTSVVLSNP